MTKVYSVSVPTKPPKGDFPGQFIEGAYTITDKIVTLTDREGHPVDDGNGRLYTETLPDNFLSCDAENAAGRLTRQFAKVLSGNAPRGFSSGSGSGFSGPLNYPKTKF